MRTITIKTNLKCKACINKLDGIIKKDSRVKHWSVDLNGSTNPLTVTGTLSIESVKYLLNKAGYSALDGPSFWMDKIIWIKASYNTLNCLVGCSIGDFGMIIFLQAYFPQATMLTQMTLAILAGLSTSIILESSLLRFREGFVWATAFQIAIRMSFLSMVAMEFAMNITDFALTGGVAAFTELNYWMALVPAMIVGFLTPLPYNYYRLRKFNKACH